jgi:hypothetical protein
MKQNSPPVNWKVVAGARQKIKQRGKISTVVFWVVTLKP